MNGLWKTAAVLGLAAGLAACSGGPAPLTRVGAQSCATTPVLGGAPRLGLGTGPTSLTFDARTACLDTPAGRATYVGFALPESADAYEVLLTSVPQGDTLLSPRVTTFAADGKPYRLVAREVFVLRGGLLRATVRVQPDERFMVIASDPASIGQPATEVTATTMEAAGVGGGFVVPRTRDTSRSISFTNAHNGLITVEARLLRP